MALFDVALEGRFAGSPDIALIDVTGVDALLIQNSADGAIMRITFDVLKSAISAALASTYEPAVAAGTTAQYYRGDKSWQTLNKAAVGLGSVDNTADAAKSVSYAATAGAAPASDVYAWAKAAVKPTYTKSEVGLSNVDNTSDIAKFAAGNAATLTTLTTSGLITATGTANTIASFRRTTAAIGNVIVGNSAGDLVFRALATGDAIIYADTGKFLDLGANGAVPIFRLHSNGVATLGTITDDTSGNKLQVNSGLSLSPSTTTTAPAAGGAGALPATPTGYATIKINGTDRKFPYY